jgi:hypothetical protein
LEFLLRAEAIKEAVKQKETVQKAQTKATPAKSHMVGASSEQEVYIPFLSFVSPLLLFMLLFLLLSLILSLLFSILFSLLFSLTF